VLRGKRGSFADKFKFDFLKRKVYGGVEFSEKKLYSMDDGKKKLSAIGMILILSLSIVIPQTIVAVQIDSMTLLADSLCMWADTACYIASVVVLTLVAANRPAYSSFLMLADLLGGCFGFLLLLLSAVYIQLRSIQVLKSAAAALKGSSVTDQIDGNWSIGFGKQKILYNIMYCSRFNTWILSIFFISFEDNH
jgi:hypothetical protein